jgi:hypothetical protein
LKYTSVIISSMKKDSTQLRHRKEHLDHIALDVEFLLISVIQGVALVTLATSAVGPMIAMQVAVWPYIAVAFLFILIFWSGAIIHAVSFIDWPTDLVHSFLYFLASILEIVAITNLMHPVLWFFFLFLFQIIAIALYWYDLQMIKERKEMFSTTSTGKALFKHIYSEQKKELQQYLPASTVLFFSSFLILYFYPNFIFQEVLIGLQFIFALLFLFKEVQTFKKRSELLLQYTF